MSLDSASLFPYLRVPDVLEQRCLGRLKGHPFRQTLLFGNHNHPLHYQLSRSTRILSTEPSVTALQIHQTDTRFLLTGSSTGKCTIYDLSRYGGATKHDEHLSPQRNTRDDRINIHTPITQTNPIMIVDSTETEQETPRGISSLRHGRNNHIQNHSTYRGNNYSRQNSHPHQNNSTQNEPRAKLAAPVTCARWHATDSGMFFSSHASGRVHIWDANTMESVVNVQPFAADARPDPDDAGFAAVTSLETTPHAPHFLAAATRNVPHIRLLDLRAGAAAVTTLTGHQTGGVTALAWSTVTAHVLASGGATDNAVRLWDIRKAGRYAWLGDGPLDGNSTTTTTTGTENGIRKAYQPDYSHWNTTVRQPVKQSSSSMFPIKPKRRGPNDYSQDRATQSHQGSVVALAFSGNGHYLASCGMDDEGIKVWDMDTRQHVVQRVFSGAPASRSRLTRMQTRLLVQDDADTLWMTRGLYTYRYNWHRGGSPLQRLTGHLQRIQAVDLCPESGNLVTGGADGLVLLWESSTRMSHNKTSASKACRQNNPGVDQDNW